MPRAELARLCRNICVQRERSEQASRSYEAEFHQALSEIQALFGLDSVSEEDLWEVVRAEEKRVADAAVIAELLLPRLVTALRPKVPPQAPSLAAPQPAAPEPRAANAAPLGVADLLEGMLDQQRSEARSRSASRS